MVLNTRLIRQFKSNREGKKLQMLTCYDYTQASILNRTEVDMLLVGDSLGNLMLGHRHTLQVTKEEMIIFAKAVRRGAPDKFMVVDMPFGTISSHDQSLEDCINIFKTTKCEAIKIEGAFPTQLKLIETLFQIGIPVMGHIGLIPQSVHRLGGYYKHGKNSEDALDLVNQAKQLEKAGAFSVVLECVEEKVARSITKSLNIPTIGIGSGPSVDGDVSVTHDLLGLTPGKSPSFASPLANLKDDIQLMINQFIQEKSADSNQLISIRREINEQ
jgi:3-methyl-2-oxobutanoate hydroxymethyltransferase